MKNSFLVLTMDSSRREHALRVVASLDDALSTWRPTTRISPLFAYANGEFLQPFEEPFTGENFLVFAGPHAPTIPQEVWQSSTIWLTLGVFNLCFHATDRRAIDQLLEWLSGRDANYECWTIVDGVVSSVEFSAPRDSMSRWREPLLRLASSPVPPELDELVKEFCPQLASAASRAEEFLPEVIPDLEAALQFVNTTIPNRNERAERVSAHEGVKILTTMNAALSRFSSQAFSGTSPIFNTECHFWTHSLLGTGVPNIALWRFASFIMETLGREAIPTRIAAMRGLSAPWTPCIEAISARDDFWYTDHLSQIRIPQEFADEVKLQPITCYSGRDGYKSTLYSLSAPLAVIGACNSLRWTLLTLTHEICHNLIRAVLAKLYPNPDDEGIAAALQLLAGEPQNLLQSLQRHLLVSLVALEQVEQDMRPVVLNERTLRIILERWHNEVEEIMVHVCDFLYFYEGNAEKYIRGIWLSWGVIPTIGNRVPEYVTRTLCASMALHLRRGTETETITRDDVRGVLQGMDRGGERGDYIDKGVRYIDENWPLIQKRLLARRNIVLLVRAFLYSDDVAMRLRTDEIIGGGASSHQGYPFTSRRFEEGVISNPLRFVDAYTTSTVPSVVDSLWMLYMLAFNAGGNHGTA
jgi:hypothetical protein